MGTTGIESSARPASPGDELSFEVVSRPENVAVARRAVTRFLRGYDASPALVDDVQLLASELVTNALQHGRFGPIGVTLRVDPSVDVTLSVASIGPVGAIPPVATWRLPTGLPTSGRGLGIVRSLSDEIELRGDGERAEVVCRRDWVRVERSS